MVPQEGYVAEVFLSIQGEGLYVGILQVFVRTAGCSRRCDYCDTPEARERVPRCALRGLGNVQYADNPIDAGELVSFVRSLAGMHSHVHSVSMTGGEPLEQPGFLVAFLSRLRSDGLPIYLETNGLEESACSEVMPFIDIVSLDIKLPSLCGGGDLFETYRRVLPLFMSKEIFVKVVITEKADEREFDEAVRLVAAFDRSIPFVIQPVHTEVQGGRMGIDALVRFSLTAARYLNNVRVIPQCHRLLGVP